MTGGEILESPKRDISMDKFPVFPKPALIAAATAAAIAFFGGLGWGMTPGDADNAQLQGDVSALECPW